MASGDRVPLIFNLGRSWWVVDYITQSFIPQEIMPSFHWIGYWGIPVSRSGHSGVENCVLLLGYSAHSKWMYCLNCRGWKIRNWEVPEISRGIVFVQILAKSVALCPKYWCPISNQMTDGQKHGVSKTNVVLQGHFSLRKPVSDVSVA